MSGPVHSPEAPFLDREEAGQRLARAVARVGPFRRPVVLALPRGGLPVARPVAEALDAPLDVLVVRKLGLPSQPELAMGAIASGGGLVLEEELIAQAGVPSHVVAESIRRERRVLEDREERYRKARPAEPLAGRTVLLVDDGLATGATMSAAVDAARRAGASEVIVAVPVAPPDTCARLEREADRVVCVKVPETFWAVGEWYRDFRPVDDAEVVTILSRALDSGRAARPGDCTAPSSA